jgi:hypothetical protein
MGVASISSKKVRSTRSPFPGWLSANFDLTNAHLLSVQIGVLNAGDEARLPLKGCLDPGSVPSS